MRAGLGRGSAIEKLGIFHHHVLRRGVTVPMPGASEPDFWGNRLRRYGHTGRKNPALYVTDSSSRRLYGASTMRSRRAGAS